MAASEVCHPLGRCGNQGLEKFVHCLSVTLQSCLTPGCLRNPTQGESLKGDIQTCKGTEQMASLPFWLGSPKVVGRQGGSSVDPWARGRKWEAKNSGNNNSGANVKESQNV